MESFGGISDVMSKIGILKENSVLSVKTQYSKIYYRRENRCLRKGTVGSNPTPSAKRDFVPLGLPIFVEASPLLNSLSPSETQ